VQVHAHCAPTTRTYESNTCYTYTRVYDRSL
jgi:hypothetical protein